MPASLEGGGGGDKASRCVCVFVGERRKRLSDAANAEVF